MIRAAVISPLALAACDSGMVRPDGAAPDYRGAETRMLDDDLLQVEAKMAGTASGEDASAYARCVAARYALDHDFGFARHLRTNLTEKGGVWTADAVYTISPSLPRGLATGDAEVEVAGCAENGIPTV